MWIRLREEATDQAKSISGADHAHVQPHSGVGRELVAFWSSLAEYRIKAPITRKKNQ
jgi:glycine/serine hydroxymethyltransferase